MVEHIRRAHGVVAECRHHRRQQPRAAKTGVDDKKFSILSQRLLCEPDKVVNRRRASILQYAKPSAFFLFILRRRPARRLEKRWVRQHHIERPPHFTIVQQRPRVFHDIPRHDVERIARSRVRLDASSKPLAAVPLRLDERRARGPRSRQRVREPDRPARARPEVARAIGETLDVAAASSREPREGQGVDARAVADFALHHAKLRGAEHVESFAVGDARRARSGRKRADDRRRGTSGARGRERGAHGWGVARARRRLPSRASSVAASSSSLGYKRLRGRASPVLLINR